MTLSNNTKGDFGINISFGGHIKMTNFKDTFFYMAARTLMVHARTSSGPPVKKYSSCSAA